MDMVERVARRIFRAYVGGRDDAAWDLASEDVRDFYRPIARAAIEEMREPTLPEFDWAEDAAPGFQEWWPRVIDAALKEKEG